MPAADDEEPKSSQVAALSERLESWKEIATYLKREVRTVQRWEKDEGLPIHRQMHKSLGTVYAYKAELDGWWNNGRHRFGPPEGEPALQELTAVVAEEIGGHRPPLQEVELQPPARGRLRLGLAVTGAVLVCASLSAYLAFRSPTPAPKVTGYTQLTSDGQWKSGHLLIGGSRLYFIEQASGGVPTLVSMPESGGDPSPINIPFRQFRLVATSARRSELLFGTPAAPGSHVKPLWTLPLAGGTPRRLGSLFAEQAAWSPDGERIAYSDNRELYLADGDGTDARKIASLPGEIVSLSWSPDGRRLRLYVDAPDREEKGFWDIEADGSGVHRIPNWGQFSSWGEWTPGARYFLFESLLEFGGKKMLWAWPEHSGLLRRTTGAPVQLEPAGLLNILDETLSPDGKKVFVIGQQRRPELTRYDSAIHEFVPFLGGIPAEWASFSRDGKRVVYLHVPDQTLWRAKADGTEPVQLTFAPLKGDGLSWSPDGQTIALRAQMPGQPWRIYLIPAEGGTPEPLTVGTQDEGIPTWSADGKEIAFGDVPAIFGQDDGHHAIHLVNVKTRAESDLPGSKGMWTSRWSPDGRYIVAQWITSQYLCLFDFTTRKWRELVDQQTDSPTWSRDGKYLYFDAPQRVDIYRVRIIDGAIEKVASPTVNERAPSWRLGLAPDDSPLITRDMGFTEIYALDVDLP